MARPKREDLAREKRQTILDAAGRIFRKKGLDGASMRAIAAEAGYTTGSIYALFQGKEEIYGTLLERTLVTVRSAMLDAVALSDRSGGNDHDALAAAARAFAQHFLDNRFDTELGLYMFGGSTLGRDLDTHLNNCLVQALSVFADTITRCVPDIDDDTCTDLRDALFSALIGVAMFEFSGRTASIRSSSDRLINTHIDNFQHRLRSLRTP